METFGIFHGHLVYFVVVWYVVWLLREFYCRLVYISRIGILHKGKSSITDYHTIIKNVSASFCCVELLVSMHTKDLGTHD
jgi:hypothetical protein